MSLKAIELDSLPPNSSVLARDAFLHGLVGPILLCGGAPFDLFPSFKATWQFLLAPPKR